MLWSKVYQLMSTVLTEARTNSMIAPSHGDEIEDFVKNKVRELPDDQVHHIGKKKFGTDWPFPTKFHLYKYMLARNYLTPVGTTFRPMQDALNKHKEQIIDLYNQNFGDTVSGFEGRLYEFLSQNEPDAVVDTGTLMDTRLRKALISGWIRDNILADKLETTSYPSMIDEISKNMELMQANNTANKLSTMYGFNVTEYHVQHIIQELKGDRNINIKWWKEELVEPWMLSKLKKSNYKIANVRNLHGAYLQIFKDRSNANDTDGVGFSYMLKKVASRHSDSKLETTRRSKDHMNVQDLYTEYKDEIDKVIFDITTTYDEKREQISNIIGVGLTSYNYLALKALAEKSAPTSHRTLHTKNDMHLKLLSIKDEILDYSKRSTIKGLLAWVEQRVGFKVSLQNLKSLGLYQTMPRSETFKSLADHKDEIQNMKHEGKSNEFIVRWLSHEFDIETDVPQLNRFLSAHGNDRNRAGQKYDMRNRD